MRCIDDGYDFIWKGSKGEDPYFIKPDGKLVPLTVNDYVPYLAAKPGHLAAAPAKKVARREAVPVADVEPGRDPGEFIIDVERDDSPLDLDKFAAGMEELASSDPPKGTPRPDSSRPDVVYVDISGKKKEEDKDSSSPPEGEAFVVDFSSKRSQGEQALREEAKSKSHLLCHLPKNPFCKTCQQAKMLKPPSRVSGGSKHIDAERFAEHLTADFLIAATDEEAGLDGEQVAMVVKDVATDFMYIYPSGRRTAKDAVLALKHFIGHNDEVGIMYSDNAPELLSALKDLKWRHVLSKEYISKSNAIAERSIRSVLEGARVNLHQAGLHHMYWPHSARHWCMMQNVMSRTGSDTPWTFWGKLQRSTDPVWVSH